MANIIRIKRGLKANIAQLELLPGELGVTLDTQELYVGDANSTPQLIKGAAAGVVESAEKLSTARNIIVSGDATGSTAFDGSKDATIALTLATSGVEAGTYNNVTVNAKGIVTAGSNKVYSIEDITGLSDALDAKANADDVYKKSEVDAKINAKDSLPVQTGNAGKFLTTNGTSASWAEVDLSSKADASSVYTKEETDGLLDAKANASSVYTKTQTNDLLDAKANTSDVNTALAAKADTTTVNSLEETLNSKIDAKASKATTLTGYGITDAYTKTEVDGMVAGTFHFRGEKASYEELTALTGMKEGDVYQVGDKEYAYNGTEWVELGFNVDLSGYLTTDAANKTYATITNLATKADSDSVYTKTQTDNLLNAKAAKATTLAGYGITDAYTKTAVDGLLDDKADAATTLAGYQISDAYTKTEVDTKVSTINSNLATKLDANSVIDGGTFE